MRSILSNHESNSIFIFLCSPFKSWERECEKLNGLPSLWHAAPPSQTKYFTSLPALSSQVHPPKSILKKKRRDPKAKKLRGRFAPEWLRITPRIPPRIPPKNPPKSRASERTWLPPSRPLYGITNKRKPARHTLISTYVTQFQLCHSFPVSTPTQILP